jgi:hypothetical protein
MGVAHALQAIAHGVGFYKNKHMADKNRGHSNNLQGGPTAGSSFSDVGVWACAFELAIAGAVLPPASGVADAVKVNASAPTHSFALLRAQVLQMGWRELSCDGHRRAQLSANTWDGLTP